MIVRKFATAGVVAILGLAVGSASAAAASGGNSAAAHACQQGAWKQLANGSGGSFTNAGDCVSYAAQGGNFGATTPFLTLTPVSGNRVDFNGGGLEPGAPVALCDGSLDPSGCNDQLGNVFSDGTFVGDISPCTVGEYFETLSPSGATIDSNTVTACL